MAIDHGSSPVEHPLLQTRSGAETDLARSLAQDANNYFGIKAIGSLGTDGVVWLPTSEFDDSGKAYATVSAFRAYRSLTDSVADHDHLLRTSSRYAAAMQQLRLTRLLANISPSKTCFSFLLSRCTLQEARLLG